MAPLTDRVCPLNIVGPMELSMVMEHVTGFPVVAADDPDTYCPTEHDAAANKLKPRRPESAASSDSAAAVKVGRNVRMLARGSFVTSDRRANVSVLVADLRYYRTTEDKTQRHR